MILGSGWDKSLKDARCLAEISYADHPFFPAGVIAGHAGLLRILDWHGWRILAFHGRWHCYQGLSAFETTSPVRLAASLGVSRMVLTCATGGINPVFAPGDFMLVTDHLNFLGDNPLRHSSPRFIDLSTLYRTDFFNELKAIAGGQGVALHQGVLAAMPGPSYETPAEIVMLERLGADAVSMSTIPEAIMARSLGMEVVALALIANLAAGRASGAIEHADVLACGNRSAEAASSMLAGLVTCWQKD